MENLKNFFNKLMVEIGVTANINNLSIEQTRSIVKELNRYLYTNYEGLGTTFELGEYREYFSEFHKFWERYHRDIINPQINNNKCELVADKLHDVFCTYPNAFNELYDTYGQSSPNKCVISPVISRFFI